MNSKLIAEFRNIFQKEAEHAYFSPGRVNLIGEHIDYNGGLVLPCAISFGTYVLAAPNEDAIFRFRSLNFDQHADIPVRQSYKKEQEYWYNYPLGIIDAFTRQGHPVAGLDLLFFGDIPISSGLSSSASIEVATACLLNDIWRAAYSRLDLVKMSKTVENTFIGVNCGIMDQFAVAFGEKNKALMLDCDTLAYEAVECNLGDHLLAIINTNKPRNLAESKYNERVQECQTALNDLQQELQIVHLCDIDSMTLEKHRHLIKDPTVLMRARHVVEENERVKHAAGALAAHNLAAFGDLMYASHDSLKNLYEVSGRELDAIVDYCKTCPDVAGARMTGAGFGGCAIALVTSAAFESFSKGITAYYSAEIGYAPSVYSSAIGDGAGPLALKKNA